MHTRPLYTSESVYFMGFIKHIIFFFCKCKYLHTRTRETEENTTIKKTSTGRFCAIISICESFSVFLELYMMKVHFDMST